MACNLTSGISIDCNPSVGGIKTVFVTEVANKDTLEVSGGTVTTLDLAAGTQFWQYDFRKQTGTFTETVTVSTDTGSVFFAPEVTMQFSRLEVNKRNEFALLALNDVMVIVLDNNGKYWLVGSQNGLAVSTGTAQTGQAFTDLNGYSITLTGGEPEAMYEVPEALIPALLEPA